MHPLRCPLQAGAGSDPEARGPAPGDPGTAPAAPGSPQNTQQWRRPQGNHPPPPCGGRGFRPSRPHVDLAPCDPVCVTVAIQPKTLFPASGVFHGLCPPVRVQPGGHILPRDRESPTMESAGDQARGTGHSPPRMSSQSSSRSPALGLRPQQLAPLGGGRGRGPLSTQRRAPGQGLRTGPMQAIPRDDLEAESSDHFLVDAVTSWGHRGLLPPDSSLTVGSPLPRPRWSPHSTPLFWVRPCWVTGCLTLRAQTHSLS